MNIERQHGLLSVSMDIDPAKYDMGIEKQMILQPVVKSKEGNDSTVFPCIILAGRNSYFSTERKGDFGGVLLRAGSGNSFHYTAAVDWQPWMEESGLALRSRVEGCCGKPENEESVTPVASLDWRPAEFQALFNYAIPVDEGPKTRKLSGKAYVNFPVNRTEIFPDYMLNPEELRKITGSIDSVRNNPDATVKGITLIGFASPEGPYDNNVRLAAGRTEAVKEYVRKLYTFSRDVFHTQSVPEDWEGLRDSVATSILPDRDEILRFIDSANVPVQRRNDELKSRFPSSYAYLLKHVYPWLRHTNYVIDYEIRDYTGLSEILHVLKERPQNLSLNEFYRAANSYPVGSPEFNDIMELALVYHKDNETACLNAANSAMAEGDFKRARMLLQRLDASPQLSYAMGTLEAFEGNLDKAEREFKDAEKSGIPEASDALSRLRQLRIKKNHVIYLSND